MAGSGRRQPPRTSPRPRGRLLGGGSQQPVAPVQGARGGRGSSESVILQRPREPWDEGRGAQASRSELGAPRAANPVPRAWCSSDVETQRRAPRSGLGRPGHPGHTRSWTPWRDRVSFPAGVAPGSPAGSGRRVTNAGDVEADVSGFWRGQAGPAQQGRDGSCCRPQWLSGGHGAEAPPPRLAGSAHASPRRADPSRGVCVCGIMCVHMRLSACMPVACVRVRMHVGVHLCVSVASEAEPCVRAPGCERAAHQPRCEGAPKAGRAPPPRNEGPSGPAVYCHQQNFSHT